MNGRFEQSDADGDEDYDGRRGRYDDQDFGRYDQRNGRSEEPGATSAGPD